MSMSKQQPPTLKELRLHGTRNFPCAAYQTRMKGTGTMVKHHWHDEVEILYFFGGEFRLEINMESFYISSECFYFINPGELHSISIEKEGSAGENAVVFHPVILSFPSYDETQSQIIQPITSKTLLFPRCIPKEHPAFLSVRQSFYEIMDAFGQPHNEKEAPFDTAVTDDLTCQLFIKSSLLRILAILSAHDLFMPTEKNHDRRIEIIKTALTYIHENYKEKIYIHDLADLIGMNEQYFCRFFKKAIGRSPIEYINEHRIKQAMICLEETSLSVTDVCLECGYNNLGNFLREFRKYTGTTPLQYRKKKSL